MMKRMAVIVAMTVAIGLGAQEAGKKSVPQLKPEVALELTRTQNELFKLSLQMKGLEAQYQALQKQMTETQGKYVALAGEALKKSDLDPSRFSLNQETLEVTEIPAKPSPRADGPLVPAKP